MADYLSRGGDDNIYNGGGFGGMWGLVIFLFLMFAIFAGGGFLGRRRDGDHDEYGCGPKPWFIDRDVIEQGCKDRAETACDGEKTRNLIYHEAERNNDRYTRNLETENSNLKQSMMFDNKLAALFGAMEKGFCKTDHDIERLACELPKRQPVWAECVTPCVRDLDRGCERRERECFC